ncbi:MAG: transferase, partial [Candidatus Omnitrophica bacterium CG07_land_8_20_14_0_80_50_8]
MKGCDLVIDNLIFRVYGVLSVEAMAMGIPVMSNIDNKYFDNCPIIECNKENI